MSSLAAGGRYHFDSAEIRDALNVSPAAAKLSLNRLKKQGLIASPARGFHVIVPPEHRSIGCLPADQFIPNLMQHLGLEYYAGLLSAAQYYGAAHHRPQEFQVFVERNRRPIVCGRVRVAFIARKALKAIPTRSINTPRGTIRISSPEATAIDLAGYPRHAGGLDNVMTVLAELAEKIDPGLLMQAADTAPLPWLQRLGYLMETVGAEHKTESLRAYVKANANKYVHLAPSHEQNGERAPDWKLIVNEYVEAEY